MAKAASYGILFWGFLLFGSTAYAQQPVPTKVERIDVKGNRRIPPETIRSSIVQTREGEAYEESNIEFDLRSLYKTNFFENIEVQETDGDIGKIVTFIVKEKPLIRSIEYSGNKSFTESGILDNFKEKKVGLTVDSQYDPSKIRAAERAIKDLMVQNGKPLGTVRTEIEEIPPISVRVRFVIDEGQSVRIGLIRFTGNKIFSDAQLRNALKLNKERSLFTMLKGLDKYHKEKLEYDIDANLKAFYQEHGYMMVQIGQPVTRIFEGPRGSIPMARKTKEQFFIEIPIDAGDQYRLGTLEVKDCGPIFSCDALRGAFGLKKGDVVNFKRIKDTLEQIKKLYGNIGYLNFSYIPIPNPDPKTKTYDLTLNLQPDKQFFVRRINFTGNTKTRDKVMRREFILEEGKVFSSTALDNSVLRLNQLGFFEKIEEKDYDVKTDEKTYTVDVNLKVKEKGQQSIGFSGGVSGISGSFLGLNYATNNFLGRGEALEASITAGTRTTNYVLSFTEPYLFDTRWTMQASLYSQRYRYDSYTTFGVLQSTGEPTELFTQKTTGTTFNINRRLGRTLWSFGSSYTYQSIGITDIIKGLESFALSQFTAFSPGGKPSDALKGIIRSELTPMLKYDSTNSYFMASRGTSVSLSAAVSGGALGGDFSMVRPVLEVRHFFPDKWLSKGHNVFALRLQGQYVTSYANSTVPFFDRFFLGGENDIRGFDLRSLSPLAVTSTPLVDVNGKPIIDLKTGLPRIDQSQPFSVGGDTVGIFNFEYRIPVAGPLSLSAFYDMGMIRASRIRSLGSFGASQIEVIGSTNKVLRGSTGLEVQFVLPVVSAPFRLIFAYNPQRLDTTITTAGSTYSIKEPNHDVKFTVGRSF
jgi:outer membrane protein insertion porin family